MLDSTLEMARRQARERPTAIAWSAPERDWTFADVDTLTNRLGQALQARGVGPGDRVACLTRHQPECAMLTIAAQKVGAVCMPMNWRLAAPEVAWILADGQARLLLTDPEFAATADAGTAALGCTVVATRSGTRWPALGDWVAGHPDTDPGHLAQPEEIALQMYSSGTTGLPKGVTLSHRAMAHAYQLGVTLEWHYDPARHVSLNALPSFHIAGHGVTMMTHGQGGRCVTLPEFDAARVVDLLERERITHTFLVPAMLQAMLRVPGVERRDFSALELISYGAAPISQPLLERALRVFGCGFMQIYGLTETCGAATVLRPADHVLEGPRADLLRSAGQPMVDVELRIVRPGTHEPCPDGEVGELWMRSPKTMSGYWRNPAATAEALEPEGAGGMPWLRTGDAGYLRDGYLFLHDRLKDMIVSGGENVYPAEVENALMQHPAVADAAVIGVPDERWGEAVKAIVVLRPDTVADPASIIGFVRGRIAHYKCPKSVDLVGSIPRNPSGKILKRVLREPYWSGRDRRIA
jgi:acyl-CoA synthetase (AMP-forming)/AMP-acid ligase II